MKKIIIILFILLSITSCVEKYWPEMTKYEDVLVVDGVLTNGNEACEVRLSYSSSINNDKLIPINNAELCITDNNNIETSLVETGDGVYQVSDTLFRGQIGNSYQLHIALANGRTYISDIEILKAPSPIDSVYGVHELHEDINFNHDISGIQFYLDNHSNISDTCYYLWKLSQTFEYHSTFDIDYLYVGWFMPNPNPDSLNTCWATSNVDKIFTMSTEHLNNPEITNFPLIYISTQTKQLSVRYSLLVKQLSISKTAFNFWDALRQQDIDQGNLYSRQPLQIRGNVKNINNDDETVLGYFTVAGITKKRIYVNRPVLPFYYDICVPNFDRLAFINFEPPSEWPIYIVYIPDMGKAGANTKSCFDCRLEGGSITPPDFWEN